jgi:polyhydroxybutyrate depolymerase
MKRAFFKLAAGLAIFSSLVLTCRAAEGESFDRTIESGGMERTYRLYVPAKYQKGKPAPLVFVFHGGGGDIDKAEKLGFNALADREGFLVAYPLAYQKNWNDGRGGKTIRSQQENIDDIGFVVAMIDEISKKHSVDPRRIYATGPSNGGFISNRIGAELSDRFAAIAPVIGGMAPAVYESFKPSDPVSVLIMQGTDDPLVLFAGGDVQLKFLPQRLDRGKNVDTCATVMKWVEHNGCNPVPVITELPNKATDDGSFVILNSYSGGRKGTEVLFYTIDGGGHTWPGGSQYLPERMIGRVNRDIDATEVIWEFFKSHPKR